MLVSHVRKVDPEHMALVKEQELKNSEVQLSFYEAEIGRLRNRIEELSGVDKLIALEDSVRENKEKIGELKKITKDLEKVKKENGDTLERLTNGDAYHNKIKSQIFEIKIWKDKQDRLDQKMATNEEVAEKQSDRVVEV